MKQKRFVPASHLGDSSKEVYILIIEQIEITPKIGRKEITPCEVHDHGFAPALFAHEISPAIVGNPNTKTVFDDWRNGAGVLRVLVLREVDRIAVIKRGKRTGGGAFHVQAGFEKQIAVERPKRRAQSPIPHDKDIRSRGPGGRRDIYEIRKAE